MGSQNLKTSDLSDQHSNIMFSEPGLKSFGGKTHFHGLAVTVHVFEDNILVRDILMTENGQGRVLIVDGEGSLRCALFGDQMAELAIERGWEGIVINGAIRDSAELSKMNLGVLARGTHPRKSGKKGDGTKAVPVQFLGVTILPGDFVVVDPDGMIVSRKPLFEP